MRYPLLSDSVLDHPITCLILAEALTFNLDSAITFKYKWIFYLGHCVCDILSNVIILILALACDDLFIFFL